MVSKRKAPPVPEQIKVWVRSGGHCAICHRYLLESGINYEVEKLGELAHIVGQSDGALAPRGLSHLSKSERNLAENLLLACAHCHNDIDKRLQAKRLDVHWLLMIKQRHEQRIRQATDLAASEITVLLRMVGHIRDGSVEIGALEAVAAVNALAERAPELLLDPNRAGAEIDLRSLPGEDDPITSGYYATACRRITEVITERLKPAVERGEIPHLSVFGLARLPLLVFLGSRLDDTVSTGIFQRHRATESWIWDDDEPDVTFRHRVDEAGDAGSTAANLIVNASGAIDVKSIPEHLAGLPTFVIEPVDHVPNRDSIRTRATRDSFHKAVSDLLGYIEVHNKPVKALHLFAAAPASAAIILGRSVGWGFHPNLLVYDAVEGTYQLALEVTGP